MPSLIDRLQDLADAQGFCLTSHPRLLAAMLLSDWVFAQHPKSVKQVVEVMLSGLGLRFLLTSNSRRLGSGTPLALPEQCGRQELLTACFDLLKRGVPRDFALDIIDLIKNNGTYDTKERWFEMIDSVSITEEEWLYYGYHLGFLQNVSTSELEHRVNVDKVADDEIDLLFRSRRFDVLMRTEDRSENVIRAILSRSITVLGSRRSDSVLEAFAQVVDPSRYLFALAYKSSMPLNQLWDEVRQSQFPKIDSSSFQKEQLDQNTQKCLDCIKAAEAAYTKPATEWALSVSPWNGVIESLRAEWGETWAGIVLANVAAGIKSPRETCTDSPELLDESKPLCNRARYARLRAGSPQWWKRQIGVASTQIDFLLVAHLLSSWGSVPTLLGVLDELEVLVANFSEASWNQIASESSAPSHFIYGYAFWPARTIKVQHLPSSMSPRMATLLAGHSTRETAKILYDKYIAQYEGSDAKVLDFALSIGGASSELLNESWKSALQVTSRAYLQGSLPTPYSTHIFNRHHGADIPLSVAQAVVNQPDNYPTFLVGLAEAKFRSIVGKSTESVVLTAKRDRWFDFKM